MSCRQRAFPREAVWFCSPYMNQEVNTETKRKVAKITGAFCALGGLCIGITMGQATGTSVVGALIGFVVGYVGAIISPVLGFALILISAVVFWHSYTMWAKPSSPKPLPVTVDPDVVLKEFRRKKTVVPKIPESSATPTSADGNL